MDFSRDKFYWYDTIAIKRNHTKLIMGEIEGVEGGDGGKMIEIRTDTKMLLSKWYWSDTNTDTCNIYWI